MKRLLKVNRSPDDTAAWSAIPRRVCCWPPPGRPSAVSMDRPVSPTRPPLLPGTCRHPDVERRHPPPLARHSDWLRTCSSTWCRQRPQGRLAQPVSQSYPPWYPFWPADALSLRRISRMTHRTAKKRQDQLIWQKIKQSINQSSNRSINRSNNRSIERMNDRSINPSTDRGKWTSFQPWSDLFTEERKRSHDSAV